LAGGAADGCFLGDSQATTPPESTGAGSYIPDMNAWQGKSSAVISCYYDTSSGLFTDQVPEIWNVFHAIPMLNITDGYNPLLGNPGSETSYQNLQAFGTALGQWITGTDNLGNAAPAGGRRIYLRLDWEANGDWYAYSPLWAALPPGNCQQLANNEVLFVDRWQQVYKAIMNAATAAAGRDLSNNVAWIYSVNAWPNGIPWGHLNNVPDLSGCTSPTQGTATIYEPTSLLGINGTQGVTTTGTVADPANVEASIYPMTNYNGPDYNSSTQYAQWLGMDGYSQCADNAPTSYTPSGVFANELNTLRGFSSLPMSVNEVGTTVQGNNGGSCPAGTTAAQKGAWLSQYMSYAQSAGIKMSMPFNEDYGGEDYALFCEPQSENGYDNECMGDSTYSGTAEPTYNVYSEYPQALASSYFIGSDPSNPQVLTDAQFLGQ
jgi:hypothetical protein